MLRKVGKSADFQVSGLSGSMAGKLLQVIFSAVLLTLPFADGRLWIFAWFGFLPLFFALRDSSRSKAFFLSYLTGLVFWLFTIYWLIHVTLLGLILLVLYLALYFGIFGIVFSYYTRYAIRYTPILIPSVWVLLEYLRSHLFTGFPWALLGYSQYQNLAVIQMADITGCWGVSFLVICGNVAIYSFVRRRKIFLFCLFCIFSALTYGYYRLYAIRNTPYAMRHRVSVIQGNIPQELKWDPDARTYIFETYSRLTEEAAEDSPDLIVWPEASLPGILGEETFVLQEIVSLSKRIKIPLLLGAVVLDKERYFNSALLFDGGKAAARYDKLHLVPFGEYIPLKNILPFLATVVPIGDITAGDKDTVFTQYARHGTAGRIKFSVLICFEDLFPEISRGFVNKGALFLINITNDAWYKKTSASRQHLQASVFRAVENRVFLVRSANTGISVFIDPTGRITSPVKDAENRDIFVRGFRTQEIAAQKEGLSFYSRYQDAFIFLLLFWVIYCIFRLKLRLKTAEK